VRCFAFLKDYSIDNLKYKAIKSIIYFCALKISEAGNLEIKDINYYAIMVKL